MGMFARSHIRLPLMDWARVTPRPEQRQAPTTREISCPFCGQNLRVPIRALNTRCTDCHKHLRLEDIVVRGDWPVTRLSTCGSILIEPTGKINGVLQAAHVIIAGRVMGTVIGTQCVEVTSTGKIAGTIATRDLKADPLALIDGQVNLLHDDGSITTVSTGEDHTLQAMQPIRPGEAAA